MLPVDFAEFTSQEAYNNAKQRRYKLKKNRAKQDHHFNEIFNIHAITY